MNLNVLSFINNYTHALVRLAVFAPPPVDGPQQPLQLVGAVVSLFNGIEDLPPRAGGPSCFRLPKKQGSLFYDELVMTAEKAMNWYRSDFDSLQTPMPEEAPKKSDGKPLLATQWQDLPAWPVMGARFDTTQNYWDNSANNLPFSIGEPTQFHRRLTADASWDVDACESLGSIIYDQSEAVEFLHQRLHINFHDYPEYLGGMCLLVPNTQVQDIKLFLESSNEVDETLIIQVTAQPKKDFKDLSIILMSVQDDVLTHCDKYSIPSSGLLLIPHKGKLQQTALVLIHEDQGVLLQQPLTSFYRQMSSSISSSAVNGSNVITAPSTDKKNSTNTTYTKADYLTNNTKVIGEGPTAVEERIARSAGARRLRIQRKRYEQQWFSSTDREKALSFVREKLSGSRERIIIADPYFNKLQIKQLLYAVPQGNCDITILTNADIFKANNRETNSRAQEFNEALNELLYTHKLSNLNILVAESAEAKFHDRFLIVDHSAWLLGSSLNSLGTQPTMVIRIPDPQVVITEIRTLMSRSMPFTDYLKSLK